MHVIFRLSAANESPMLRKTEIICTTAGKNRTSALECLECPGRLGMPRAPRNASVILAAPGRLGFARVPSRLGFPGASGSLGIPI